MKQYDKKVLSKDFCNKLIEYAEIDDNLKREVNFQKEVSRFYMTGDNIPKWIFDELDNLIKTNLGELYFIKHWIVILRYTKGDFFRKHTDDSYDDRLLSGGVELNPNSDYKGGRLITSNKINKTAVGEFFTHTTKESHFVETITEGVRYSLHFPVHKLSDWKLVYCLSKRLAKTEDAWNTTIELFKKSVQMSSVFHKVKLYTDSETKQYIDFDIEIEILEVNDLSFLDNYKIQILPLLHDNEILIDPDVFLKKELIIDSSKDLIVDRPDSSNNKWYDIEFDMAKEYKFSELIEFKKNATIPNIGIFKFFNKQLQKDYIDNYNKIKSCTVEEVKKLPPFPRFSILLGQVSLENILSKDIYSIGYCSRKKENDYLHTAGEEKFKKDSVNNLEDFLNREKKKSIL
jgi:hypothetical protein